MQIPESLKSSLWYGHLIEGTVGAMVIGFIPAAVMDRWTHDTHSGNGRVPIARSIKPLNSR
jgi:uncharacterized protein involved in response to NO